MQDIKGTTRVCGIIGNPVAHSISPLLHNELARLTGINLVYVPFCVDADDIANAIRGAKALDILGLNVTVPHKSAVIEALDDIDSLAASIGAVNTLVRTDGGYKGYNTDISGLKRELDEAGIVLENEEVVILGAGGAARAIAFLCAEEKAKRVYILNRTTEKAQNIADAVNSHFNAVVAVAMNINDYGRLEGDSYIGIQTTSVGLYPDVDRAPVEAEEFYDKLKAGVDIIYNPARTKFMRLVEQSAGGEAAGRKKVCNGLKMLLYQGVSAFELWNNVKITGEQADIVYKAMKKELGIDDRES